jgi:hypothetical protein
VRVHSVAEAALLRAGRLVYHMRCEITNAAGAWIDYTDAYGVNWLRELKWDASIDRPVMQGTATLIREDASTGISLAPAMTTSEANVGGPAIMEGRLIRLSCAVVVPGVRPVFSDWREVLLGEVDEVEAGKKANTLAINFRDIGSRLLDAGITAVRVYGSPAGVEAWDVMQGITDDNWSVPAYGAPPVLYVPDPVASAFAVSPSYKQEQKHILEALNDLAMQFGHVVRYKYDALDAFRLTLYDPQRDKTVPDAEFTPGEYIDLPRLKRSRDDVRNQVRVIYVNAIGQSVEWYDEDPVSVAQYGPRYMQFGLDTTSQIRTLAQAVAFADAALWDLSTPISEHQTESFLFWPAELGDLYRFKRNDRQYDNDQDLAVVAYEHTFTAPGKARTTLTTRGRVSGMGRQWLRRGRVGGLPPEPAFPDISARAVYVTALNAADLYVTPTTTGGERLGLKVSRSDVADVWVAVLANGDPTPAFFDSGTEVGPGQWFQNTTSLAYADLLNDFALLAGGTTTVYVKAYGEMTQAESAWIAIVLDEIQRPQVSATLTVTETKIVLGFIVATLTLVITAGKMTQSVYLEVSDDETFPFGGYRLATEAVNLAPGATIKRTYSLLQTSGQVGKEWFAKITPNAQNVAGMLVGAIGFPVIVSSYANADTMIGGSTAGQPGGVATLDGSGKVPLSQLPPLGGLSGTTVSVTTASLANGATQTGTIALGKAGILHFVTSSAAAWVRLYGTAAARAADATRAQAIDPVPGTGVYADLFPGVSGAALAFPASPPIEYRNNDGPRTAAIYYSITNESGVTAAITVDFQILVLEV